MSHLKRAAMPGFWPMRRKGPKYATHTMPGPHPMKDSMPLRVLVRDAFGYADSAREADRIIKQGAVIVDGKPRKEPHFPVGPMDAVDLAGACYRLLPDAGGFSFIEIKKDEASRKPCIITGKATLRGGVIQLNLHDGRNVLVRSGSYRPGDTLIISVPEQKVLEHIGFKEGQKALIIDGKNRGATGVITAIRERKTMTESAGVVLDAGGRSITTLKGYVMVGSFPTPPKFARKVLEREKRRQEVEKAVAETAEKRAKAAAGKGKAESERAAGTGAPEKKEPAKPAKKTKAGKKPKTAKVRGATRKKEGRA